MLEAGEDIEKYGMAESDAQEESMKMFTHDKSLVICAFRCCVLPGSFCSADEIKQHILLGRLINTEALW